MIKQCTCTHKYQDEKYGKGQRVHNETNGRGSQKEWRCTICGSTKVSQ